jgi:hypothetical protein
MAMKLDILVMKGHTINIRPAPMERAWMDVTDQKYAYRCLPLNIANAFGWEILCEEGFIATWLGGEEITDVIVEHDSNRFTQAGSHFAHGILTFHIPCLFKTEPGVEMMVQGPVNNPKDGIYPLTGVIETAWAPYTFTHNWKFTRPYHTVRFHKGDPFCHIFPVSCDVLESVEPVIRPISTEPELEDAYEGWAESRAKFIKDLAVPESEARTAKWQKLYFRGLMPSGCPVQNSLAKHRTKLKIKEPIEKYNKNSS